ncbi:DUF2607 family protein [Shewanella sp. 10N.286.48.B5]|uniref:DUF2607 family protein n=2 Tax=Shewanella TaxID=22 RepID=UPI001056A312
MHIRRNIAMWLCAMLVLLSFAASAHESVHKHESINTHCSLCFHKHQVHKTLPSIEFSIPVVRQEYELTPLANSESLSSHQAYYHSRAPPIFI